MMNRLFLKRGAILLIIIVALVVLNVTSEENMLENLPSESDVLHSIIQKQEQEAALLKQIKKDEKAVNDALEDLQKERDKIIEDLLEPFKRDDSNDYEALFDHSNRHTFIVEFTQSEFDGLVQDMVYYNNLFGGSDYRTNNYRKVNVIYIDDDKTLVLNDVGIRTKGNVYSRRIPLDSHGNVIDTHYVLKFNETFDLVEGTDEYQELKSREVFDLEKLIFKYNNTNDPAISNEVYSTEMFHNMDVDMPNASFAELIIVIDGKVVNSSLYNIFEYFDEEYVRREFNGSTDVKEIGNLYKMVYSADLSPITNASSIGVRDWLTGYRPIYGRETNDSDTNYSDIIDFTYFLNDNNEVARKSWLEDNFNVDSFIRSLAVNVLSGNPDDYRGNLNNYYMYFDTTGYATYIPFDYDNSLGSGWAGATFTRYTLDDDIYNWGGTEGDRPLVDQILEYEEYRILYENYLEYMIRSGIFSYSQYEEFVSIPKELYPEYFIVNDKEYYFSEKIYDTLVQIEYYRGTR